MELERTALYAALLFLAICIVIACIRPRRKPMATPRETVFLPRETLWERTNRYHEGK